jgi:hypothetical protein
VEKVYTVVLKTIKKDQKVEKMLYKMTHSHFYVFFFFENFLKIVDKKKYQMNFIFLQKFNEKANKAKKIQIQLVYFIFSFYFYFLHFFLKKTPHSVFLKHDFYFTQCIVQV